MAQIQRKNPTSMITMAGLHQTVKVGPWLFIAGQVPLDSDGNFYGEGDPEKQIDQIYTNLKNACAEYGGTLSNMVKTTTYVTNTNCFAAVSKARQDAYGDNAPVNATVVVAALFKPEWSIEIEALAYIPESS